MSLIPLGFWAASGGGGGGAAFDLLETVSLTSSASSVTFSGLGAYSDYKHLQLRMITMSDSGQIIYAKVNGSTSGYYVHYLTGNGSNVSSSSFSSTYAWVGHTDTLTNAPGASIVDILDFSSTSKNTTIRSLTGKKASGSNINLNSNLWSSTAAMTSIELYPNAGNFIAGSRLSLYGVQ